MKAYKNLNPNLYGNLITSGEGESKVVFTTTDMMAVDEEQTVNMGFIFNCAHYASICAINEDNISVSGAKSSFLAPIRVGEELEFHAQTRHSETRKRQVFVSANIKGIKVFEGEFSVVILDRHPLKVNLTEDF